MVVLLGLSIPYCDSVSPLSQPQNHLLVLEGHPTGVSTKSTPQCCCLYSTITQFLLPLSRQPVDAYQTFKALSTRLSINLFLSEDMSDKEAKEISELMSEHWRGIISVPLNMKAPWAMWKSGFSKAITAKVHRLLGHGLTYLCIVSLPYDFVIWLHSAVQDRLLMIIREKLESSPSAYVSHLVLRYLVCLGEPVSDLRLHLQGCCWCEPEEFRQGGSLSAPAALHLCPPSQGYWLSHGFHNSGAFET